MAADRLPEPAEEIDAPREASLAMWDEGEPVALVGVFDIERVEHSSLCALNASGHRGPCTCGALPTTEPGVPQGSRGDDRTGVSKPPASGSVSPPVSAAVSPAEPAAHADDLDPVVMLTGRMIEKADAELIADLDCGLRWARSLISDLLADAATRRRHGDALELFMENEGNASELCWLWENPDD